MATIMEILSKPIEERKKFYNVSTSSKKIDEVDIDGQKFSGYKAFSFLWEKSYHKEPTRSSEGTIGNLNDYTSFITPHLKIDFSILSIDDYRRIMQLVYSKNEFTVTCYDVVNDRMTTNKMYFSTEEMPKLFLLNRALNGEEWIELLGIDGYTVEMIGTNADLDTVTVTYRDIDPVTGVLTTTYSKDYYQGQEIIIGDNVPFKNNSVTLNSGESYLFSGRWYIYQLDENGVWQKTENQYSDNVAIKVRLNMVLVKDYYKNSDGFYSKVFLDYGLGETKTDSYGNQILYISMRNGQEFDLEPYTTINPIALYHNKEYYPYVYKGWYYTPTPVTGSTNLDEDGEIFNDYRDITIYQVYDKREFTLKFITDTDASIDDLPAEYGEKVAIPILKKEGYTLRGWYHDDDKNKSASFLGFMPPYDATIRAYWDKKYD